MRLFPTRRPARARWFALGSVLILAVSTGGWLLRRKPAADGNVYQQARLFETVVGAIHAHYLDSIGEGDLYQRASAALVGSLHDPYAELLLRDSYREYQRQMSGTEIEVGAVSGEYGDGREPGMAPGDEVVSVDGHNTRGWSPDRIRSALEGGNGPRVRVVLRPRGSDRLVSRELTRTELHVPATSHGVLLGGGVGYLALHRVSDGAAEELRTSVQRLRDLGMRSLILDLRLNPGGLISEGVRIAGLFLHPGDTVATSLGRGEQHSKVYLAGLPGGWSDLPVTLLVNRGTASSAELIAAALQDHDRAAVIGTPTFGKGVLQTTYPLADEVALKLTTARWFTPQGRNIQRPRSDSTGSEGNRPPGFDARVFRSDAGRPLPAASGVVPDLIVRSTPRREGAVALLAVLGSDASIFRAEVGAFAGDLTLRSKRPLMITPAMRQELFARLEAANVIVPADTYDAAAPYVSDQLEYEMARQTLGPEAEVRLRARDDRQMQAAIRVLRRSRTPESAVAAAMTEQLRMQGH